MSVAILNEDSWRCVFDKLIESVREIYCLRDSLVGVCTLFNILTRGHIDSRILAMMSSSIKLRVQIAYFHNDRSGDLEEYLIGPATIVTEREITKEVANKYLGDNHIGIDQYGSVRSYESVIMEDVHLNCKWGFGNTWSSPFYVSFYRNNENEVSHNECQERIIPLTTIRNSPCWIYILRNDSHCSRAYLYVILPYCDERITSYEEHDVIKIHRLSCSTDTFILDVD